MGVFVCVHVCACTCVFVCLDGQMSFQSYYDYGEKGTDSQTHTHTHTTARYAVALVSRIDEIIGLFGKRALYKRRYSAKETCSFIDPTDRSHPIF